MDTDIFKDFNININPNAAENLTPYEKLHIKTNLLIAERLEMIAKLLRKIVERGK